MSKDWCFDNIEASGDTFSRRSTRQHSVPSTTFNGDSSPTPSGRPTRQLGQLDHNKANMSNSIFGNHGMAPDNSDRSFSIPGDDVARRSGDVQSAPSRPNTPQPGAVAMKQPRNSHTGIEDGADDESRKRKAIEQHEDQAAKKQKHTTGGEVDQVGQQEQHAADKQRLTSNGHQVQDRGEVIFVADGKRVQSGQAQQQVEDPEGNTPGKQRANDRADGETDNEGWRAKYEDLKKRANDKLKERNAEIERLKENVEDIEQDRNTWLANCREVEHELNQWKATQKQFRKDLTNEMKEVKREEMRVELNTIRAKNKRDLDIKQHKHEVEQQALDQKMKASEKKVAQDRKVLHEQEKQIKADAKQKVKEAQPQTNSVIKQKDQQLKLLNDQIKNLQASIEHQETDIRALTADVRRVKEEREKARDEFKIGFTKRELLEEQNVDLKGQLKRKEQEIQRAERKAQMHYQNNNQSALRATENSRATKALSQLNDKNIGVIADLQRQLRASQADGRKYQAMFESVQPAPAATPAALIPSRSQQSQQSHGLPSLPTVNDSLSEMPVPPVPQNSPATISTAPATQNSTPFHISENHDSRPAAGVCFNTGNGNSQAEMTAVSQDLPEKTTELQNQDMEPGANQIQTESMMTDEV